MHYKTIISKLNSVMLQVSRNAVQTWSLCILVILFVVLTFGSANFENNNYWDFGGITGRNFKHCSKE